MGEEYPPFKRKVAGNPICRPHQFMLDLDQFITFRRDANNGAGLYAVFIGDVPIHHFRPEGSKPQQYMNKVKDAVAKIVEHYVQKEDQT